jgi:hypothetical protein
MKLLTLSAKGMALFLLVMLAGCFPRYNEPTDCDGVYRSADNGTFTLHGWQALYSLNGDQVEFYNTGHMLIKSEPIASINADQSELDKHPRLQSKLEEIQRRPRINGDPNYAVIYSTFGGVLFVNGHTFRRDNATAPTYHNDRLGTITLGGGVVDGFAWEVDGYAFRGFYFKDTPTRASLLDDASPELKQYAPQVGCEHPNYYSETKRFQVSDEQIVTQNGVVFQRMR